LVLLASSSRQPGHPSCLLFDPSSGAAAEPSSSSPPAIFPPSCCMQLLINYPTTQTQPASCSLYTCCSRRARLRANGRARRRPSRFIGRRRGAAGVPARTACNAGYATATHITGPPSARAFLLYLVISLCLFSFFVRGCERSPLFYSIPISMCNLTKGRQPRCVAVFSFIFNRPVKIHHEENEFILPPRYHREARGGRDKFQY